MRFDINAFFGHWPYYPLPQTSGEDVLRLMDRFQIDRAAMTSLRAMHGDWGEANAETLRFTREHADRLTPIACMSPMLNGGGDKLRELVEEGCRAVRLYPGLAQGYHLGSPFADDIVSTAGTLGIPAIVPTRPMMHFRFPPVPIPQITALASRHPQTQIILSGPNYLLEFTMAVEALQASPNMTIEISCMQGFRGLDFMVDAVGAQRVLFGTGLPLHYAACGTAKLEHSKLTADQLAAVSSQNAVRLLGLDQ
ncbi:MAG: amidohydrolase family protein [Pirellulaceae bacterium]|nr:amidohydrolase family protein [Pirellulaceae bacterium]